MKSSVLLWRAWACAAVASAKEHCKETLTSSSTGGAVLKAAQMADSSPTNPRHPGKCLSDETKHEKGGNFMPYIRVRAWRSHLVASLGVALAFLGWLDHPAIATTMLTTGKTMADGAINLTLTVDKNTSLPLGALKLPKGTTAADKATKIAAQVNTAANLAAGWAASVVSDMITFSFKGKPIASITEDDTTQEKKTLALAPVLGEAATYAFELSTISTAVTGAAGVDGEGDAAFAEVVTPLGGTGHVLITAGESLSAIITALITALPTAVDVKRTGEASFVITEIGPDTFGGFQTADNNLSEAVTAQPVPEPASWWLFAAGCVGMLALRRRRSARNANCVA